ncbi:VanZ family protein [Flavobacterium agricola]|uniref:VanZ family protein n=1 Tax=Flavobacterium agricola TaxID=2870839 RepID=A0ABY6M0N9_9FLAO|nr:VanZ family protein [Flavobacterium agricola]UYW00763.1 VanZ family protein [Flavobacterium agricola]
MIKYYIPVFIFFLVLFWLIYFQPNKQSLKKVNSKVAISAFCLGVFIEFLQATLTTSRFADVYDVLANTVGIVLALVAYQQYIKIKTN